VRASLSTALLFALPLVACTARDVPIAPDPERAAPREELAPLQGAPEIAIPRPANGVLPPGAADAVLRQHQAPLVRLLDAGADPKSDLSYALAKGATQKLSLAMDTAMGVKSNGQSLPQTPLPRMTMLFDSTVAEKNAAGEVRIDWRLTSASVDPNGGQQEQMARALRPQLDTMKGLGTGYWLTPKGHVHDAKPELSPSMPPAAQQIMSGMSQSLESMVTPLPAEAVGAGARWQVVSRITSGGADMLESAVYTLKSRSGARASLDVTFFQLSASDTIKTPQMPAGMSARLKSFASGGTRRTELDLTSVVPESGAMAQKTTMVIAVVGAAPGAAGAPADESTVETTTAVQMARP
jgi:hypothetical protein